jgi:hypothetical protein
MRIHYAHHADVLCFVLEETTNPRRHVELESGAICWLDEVTNRIVGIAIPSFATDHQHNP